MHADFGMRSSFGDGVVASAGVSRKGQERRRRRLERLGNRKAPPCLPRRPMAPDLADIVGRFAESSNAARCREGLRQPL